MVKAAVAYRQAPSRARYRRVERSRAIARAEMSSYQSPYWKGWGVGEPLGLALGPLGLARRVAVGRW